jgi:transposase
MIMILNSGRKYSLNTSIIHALILIFYNFPILFYIKNRKGKPALQIVISFNRPENAQELYKERWQIETAFKALKSGGFNIEDTHLTDIKRIEELFSLVMVAFAWAYVVGIYVHENIKQIKIKKHGDRAKSLFKYGLQTIAAALLNPFTKLDFNIFEFLSCT